MSTEPENLRDFLTRQLKEIRKEQGMETPFWYGFRYALECTSIATGNKDIFRDHIEKTINPHTDI